MLQLSSCPDNLDKSRTRELALLYAVYYGAVAFALALGRPVGWHATVSGVDLAFDAPTMASATTYGVLVLPAVLCGMSFAALCAERVLLRQRLRVALLSLGLVGWHASLVARGVSDGSVLGPVPTAVGLLSVACVLVSFGLASSR